MRSLLNYAVGIGLLLVGGCDAMQNMRSDFARLTSLPASMTSRATAAAPPAAHPRSLPTSATSGGRLEESSKVANAPAASPPDEPAVALAGKSEADIRAMLGKPTSEEDRSPGKRWRYQDGQCTVDVQLYRDVQTKQFGTLGYEVKSDDGTTDGKRHCMAQLRSRVRAGQ